MLSHIILSKRIKFHILLFKWLKQFLRDTSLGYKIIKFKQHLFHKLSILSNRFSFKLRRISFNQSKHIDNMLNTFMKRCNELLFSSNHVYLLNISYYIKLKSFSLILTINTTTFLTTFWTILKTFTIIFSTLWFWTFASSLTSISLRTIYGLYIFTIRAFTFTIAIIIICITVTIIWFTLWFWTFAFYFSFTF